MSKLKVDQISKASGASPATFTLPASDGTAGQYMKTDGGGALSFGTVTIPAGGLTDATIWRQTTTTSASTSDTFFTANWEIPDNTDTGYATLGTAVGETATYST